MVISGFKALSWRQAISWVCLAVVPAVLGSCAGEAAKEPESLDLKPEPAKAGASTAEAPPLDEVFEWQKYFKKEPGSADARLIRKSLSGPEKGGDLAALLKRGQNLVAIGRLNDAEVEFRGALARDPGNLEALLALAQLYLEQREIQKTYQVLESIKVALDSSQDAPKRDRIRYRYLLALTLIVQGKKDLGHQIMAELVGEQSDFLPAYHAVAQSYLASGNDDLAEFVLSQLLDRAEGNSQTYNLLGVIASRRHHLGRAQDLFAKALSLNPEFLSARVNLANLYIGRGDYGLAEENLDRILKENGGNAGALVSMGVIQRETSRYKEAKASFERAIEVEPENASARLNLALLMKQAFGDELTARRLFTEVTQIPGVADRYLQLANSHLAEIRGEHLDFSERASLESSRTGSPGR